MPSPPPRATFPVPSLRDSLGNEVYQLRHFRDLRVGDPVTLPPSRHIVGRTLPEPLWYILVTAPQRERDIADWLGAWPGIETWYPTEEAWRKVPGKMKKRRVLKPFAPRYVFALFEREPQWDVIAEQGRGRVTGVVSRLVEGAAGPFELEYVPVAISERVLAAMRHVPERLAELAREIEREAELAAIAAVPQPGETVEVNAGALAGRECTVQDVSNGLVRWLYDGGAIPIHGECMVSDIRRIG